MVDLVDDQNERLGNLADKLGASFDFIQVLEDAAGRSGGSVDQLSAGFTRFLKTVSDARAGSESAAAAFGRLGIGIDAVRGTAPEQLFRSAAEAITQIQDPAARTAAAMALFGKSGADLVPTLQKIGVSAADIERLGGGLGASQRRDVDAFGDSLDRPDVFGPATSPLPTSTQARLPVEQPPPTRAANSVPPPAQAPSPEPQPAMATADDDLPF
jgi:hypothetical protein